VSLFNGFAVLNYTAALKLFTSTILFGPLGAGKLVLAIAIRTLSSGDRDSELEDCGE
jgi:hypothetical protein